MASPDQQPDERRIPHGDEHLCATCMWAENCEGRKDLVRLSEQIAHHSYIRDLKLSFQCTEYLEKVNRETG